MPQAAHSHAGCLAQTPRPAARAANSRALAKQATRGKLLAAARRLFTEQGYEGATIRDIAAAAGMSTGAVFANFSEKFDLFREIAKADMKALTTAMAAASQRHGPVEAALLEVFSTGYEFYLRQLPLIRATLSVGWNRREGRELHRVMPRQAILDIVVGVLDGGVQRGELSADAAVELRGQMLCDAYVANFGPAIFDGWTLEPLRARMAEQIDVILAGARAG